MTTQFKRLKFLLRMIIVLHSCTPISLCIIHVGFCTAASALHRTFLPLYAFFYWQINVLS